MVEKKLTVAQRLDKIESILCNEIKHELKLHRWLLGLILGAGGALLVALLVEALLGG